MAKRKLNDTEIAALRAAYEAWNPHDPDSISAAELAAQFGISKQALYTYRDRWIEEDRRRREKKAAEASDGQDMSGQAEAIVYLTTEIMKNRTVIGGMERRIAELEQQLEDLRTSNSTS